MKNSPKSRFCPHCGGKVLPDHRFCASCGTRQDFGFLDSDKVQTPEPRPNQIDFKDLFQKMESTLRRQSSLSNEDFDKHFGRFKTFDYKNDTDEELYWKIVQVVFYSGMTAATVTKRLPAIKKYFGSYRSAMDFGESDIKEMMNDKAIIRHEKKIKGCIRNAKRFSEIVKDHGSFGHYVESFGNLSEDATLEKLRKDLMKFEFLQLRGAYHLMLDMGLNVWKPDRVICRVLYRLGLIDSKNDIEKAVEVGRNVAVKVALPIRYIDIVFVKYGQKGAEEPFGLDDGICLEKNPRCHLCGIREYCVRRIGSP